VLTFAHAMTSKEALNLLSIIKLGVDLGAFPEDRRLADRRAVIDTQPAHLQKSSQQKLNAEERDELRAQIIRERLRVFPKPDISKVARESTGNGTTSEPHTMNNFTPRAQQVLALARKKLIASITTTSARSTCCSA
jgi:protein arginine kinase